MNAEPREPYGAECESQVKRGLFVAACAQAAVAAEWSASIGDGGEIGAGLVFETGCFEPTVH